MNYYGYLRVSTKTQFEKGYGIDVQEEFLRRYETEHKIKIKEIYRDEGISGCMDTIDNVNNRPGLIEMFSQLKEGDRVLVLCTSRLWRDDMAKCVVISTLKRKKADIISYNQPSYTIYSKNPSDVLFNSLMEVIDEYDRLNINQRLSLGRAQKARGGDKPAGATPFGYKYAEDKKSIVIDEKEAEIVRYIFKCRYNFVYISDICDRLTENGWLNRNNKPFIKSSVDYIIKNPFYKGEISHGSIRRIGNHEPLVSEYIWDRANRKRFDQGLQEDVSNIAGE